MRTVAFCEIDPYCRAVLKKHWPNVPCYGDIRELDGSKIECDVVSGGFPCQPFSVAGKQRGKGDDRHLWPEMLRVIEQARPAWVIGENVPGIIHMELDAVLSDLEGLGYATRAFVIPAVAADAQHRRDRVWVVAFHPNRASKPSRAFDDEMAELRCAMANTDPDRKDDSGGGVPDENWHGQEKEQERDQFQSWAYGPSSVVNPDGAQRKRGRVPIGARAEHADLGSPSRWLPEPNVDRVAHGVPRRMDRLKALGNAVVPQIPEIIGRAIMKLERTAP